eukprot:287658_1
MAESRATRDKWCVFINKSLGKDNDKDVEEAASSSGAFPNNGGSMKLVNDEIDLKKQTRPSAFSHGFIVSRIPDDDGFDDGIDSRRDDPVYKDRMQVLSDISVIPSMDSCSVVGTIFRLDEDESDEEESLIFDPGGLLADSSYHGMIQENEKFTYKKETEKVVTLDVAHSIEHLIEAVETIYGDGAMVDFIEINAGKEATYLHDAMTQNVDFFGAIKFTPNGNIVGTCITDKRMDREANLPNARKEQELMDQMIGDAFKTLNICSIEETQNHEDEKGGVDPQQIGKGCEEALQNVRDVAKVDQELLANAICNIYSDLCDEEEENNKAQPAEFIPDVANVDVAYETFDISPQTECEENENNKAQRRSIVDALRIINEPITIAYDDYTYDEDAYDSYYGYEFYEYELYDTNEVELDVLCGTLDEHDEHYDYLNGLEQTVCGMWNYRIATGADLTELSNKLQPLKDYNDGRHITHPALSDHDRLIDSVLVSNITTKGTACSLGKNYIRVQSAADGFFESHFEGRYRQVHEGITLWLLGDDYLDAHVRIARLSWPEILGPNPVYAFVFMENQTDIYAFCVVGENYLYWEDALSPWQGNDDWYVVSWTHENGYE